MIVFLFIRLWCDLMSSMQKFFAIPYWYHIWFSIAVGFILCAKVRKSLETNKKEWKSLEDKRKRSVFTARKETNSSSWNESIDYLLQIQVSNLWFYMILKPFTEEIFTWKLVVYGERLLFTDKTRAIHWNPLGFHWKSLRVSLEDMVLTGLIYSPSPKPIDNQVFKCRVKGWSNIKKISEYRRKQYL